MGRQLELINSKHEQVVRDYYSRVTDPEYPKAVAASLAKEWGYHYWDGDRRINYGGYRYVEGYWTSFASNLIDVYNLTPDSKILDVGCGKGFLLRELAQLLPGLNVQGLDISEYAVDNGDPAVKEKLLVGHASHLPFADLTFDLVISINTLHNLYAFELDPALRELERVAASKYIVVESYRTEEEKMNLLYWQVTCESFCTPAEWRWWFDMTGYSGDYEFIYFS